MKTQTYRITWISPEAETVALVTRTPSDKMVLVERGSWAASDSDVIISGIASAALSASYRNNEKINKKVLLM